MTLQGSGAISLSQVNTELGNAATQGISMNDSAVRTLAGVPSGSYGMNSFYGKSASYNVADPATPMLVGLAGSWGAAALTVNWPPGCIADDIAVLAIVTANQAIATPSGFTAISSGSGVGTAGSSGSCRLGMFWKRAGSTSPAAFTIADSGSFQHYYMWTWRGLRTSDDPVANFATSTTAATTTVAYPAVTTTVNNSLIIMRAGMSGASTATSLTSNLDNANLTSYYNSTGTLTADGGNIFQNTSVTPYSIIGYYNGVDAAAGSLPSHSQSLGTARAQERCTVAFHPASASRATTISLVNGTCSDSQIGTATAGLYMYSSGIASTDTMQTWCTNHQLGANYDVFVSMSGTGGQFSGTTGSWLNLGTTRSWTLSFGLGNDATVTRTLTVSIRPAGGGATIVSATITLSATSESDPVGGTIFL